MEKTRQALEKLSVRVAAGRLKKAKKIGEAAARILSRNHGSRYYGWSLELGLFHFFEHPGHLAPEKALEGKYVIQTERRASTLHRELPVIGRLDQPRALHCE